MLQIQSSFAFLYFSSELDSFSKKYDSKAYFSSSPSNITFLSRNSLRSFSLAISSYVKSISLLLEASICLYSSSALLGILNFSGFRFMRLKNNSPTVRNFLLSFFFLHAVFAFRLMMRVSLMLSPSYFVNSRTLPSGKSLSLSFLESAESVLGSQSIDVKQLQPFASLYMHRINLFRFLLDITS